MPCGNSRCSDTPCHSQAGELESGASGLVPHYTNLDEFFHTRVSQMLTPDYLKAAFKHYRSTAHENEGGEASEKAHAGPGEKRKVPLLTRANLLPEMEFFDHDQGFTPLNLSVAKLASLATSQGFWKPHSMFVSGTTQKTSPVCQNIWFRIRRDRSKAARMDWMNKLLYGPEYGPEDDMAIEQALTAHNDGPAPSVTNPLTYAECVHSIRTSVLPTSQVLQTPRWLHRALGSDRPARLPGCKRGCERAGRQRGAHPLRGALGHAADRERQRECTHCRCCGPPAGFCC